MNPLPPNNRNTAKQEGFSLIEVLFALFMVSTVIVAVLGLLSTGINMIGEAGDVTIKGRIAQKLIGELELAEWEKLDEYNSVEKRFRYYDDRGSELSDINAPSQVYTALTKIETTGMALPGTADSQPNLRNARIFVSGKPGIIGKQEVESMAADSNSSREVAVFSKVLVKMNNKAQP